jgi:very-short-patch-repair endonuclease
MSNYRNVVDNVQSFLSKTSVEYGRVKSLEFSGFAGWMISSELKSPIEDLFFIAFCAQVQADSYQLNPAHESDLNGGLKEPDGVFIKPQFKIGTFFADFLVYQKGLTEEKCIPTVIELDGHDFHDRNKHQRAYEKSRDRFFVQCGYRVLHFTGSEVVSDPHKVAFEVLSIIGANLKMEYNPVFPLGEWKEVAA